MTPPSLRSVALTVLAPTLAVALGLGLTTASAPAVQVSARKAPAGVTIRPGTFNINANIKIAKWRRAVDRLLPRVDVAGLQEVNHKERTAYLEHLDGWGTFHPAKTQTDPVIWDRSVFRLNSARGVKIAKAARVGHEKPGRDPRVGPSFATVVRLTERTTGDPVSVVNVHLQSGAVNGGKRIKGRPRLYKHYKSEVKSLAKVARKERAWSGGRVYVLGDFNVNYPADRRFHKHALPYHRLKKAGLVSMWERRKVIKPGHGSGTRSGAYLDGIWSSVKPYRISVEHDISLSDHYPVGAYYGLGAPRAH